jgi:acyl-CoA hydrolase
MFGDMRAASTLPSSSINGPAIDDVEQSTTIAIDTGAEVHLDEWIAPPMVDDNGLLRVGRILEWMDVGGCLAADRYCRRHSVTASVNSVEVTRPVELGEHVSMTARVVHTSRRSMGLHVSMTARGATQATDSEVLSAYMTFVPLDSGSGGEVKPWTPLTPRDRVLYREGELRREFRKKLAAGGCDTDLGAGGPQRPLISLRALAGGVRRMMSLVPEASRSPETSYIHRIEPVMPSALNMHGTLYGGTLMRWIEDAASLSARAFTGDAVVVVGVHGLDFLKAVSHNVFAHIHAMAVRSDPSSVTIRVEVTSESPLTRSVEQSLCGFLTYRPLDRRVVVPALDVHSDAERALSLESAQHLAFSRRLREASVA